MTQFGCLCKVTAAQAEMRPNLVGTSMNGSKRSSAMPQSSATEEPSPPSEQMGSAPPRLPLEKQLSIRSCRYGAPVLACTRIKLGDTDPCDRRQCRLRDRCGYWRRSLEAVARQARGPVVAAVRQYRPARSHWARPSSMNQPKPSISMPRSTARPGPVTSFSRCR